MELKELLEKAQERTISKEEVFEYFGVKNMEGLESVLSMKFDQPKESLSFLDGSLQFIYEAREKTEYNPIEEMYMFYGICAQGIYNVPMDEISILNGYFGAFRVLMMLENILKNKPEVNFFWGLYQKFIQRKEDMSYILKEGIKQVVDFAMKNLGDLDEEKLSVLLTEFKQKAEELIKEKQ